MIKCIDEIIESWETNECLSSIDSILSWISKKNNSLCVKIKKINFNQTEGWNYDSTCREIRHNKGAFFKIKGIRGILANQIIEQPIILQDEIGFLGIICKNINGVLYFLMQAKIEPGNINKIQISPTVQATKSNFEQKHGGKKPAYIDYFLNKDKHQIIVDQIQSEQSSRFLKKRNRNIIIKVNDEIEFNDNFRWMTLNQIKILMNYDNLVNMDTRTVISCIPFWYTCFEVIPSSKMKNIFLQNSIANFDQTSYIEAYSKLNDFKMFNSITYELIPLDALKTREFTGNEIKSKTVNNFKVIFCELEIEGREVKKWCQPLFEATGIATFGLLLAKFNNEYKFLVKLKNEIGCFDTVEYGPTIQKEYIDKEIKDDVERVFFTHISNSEGVIKNVLLSEEGGRFYHEQNRNYLVLIDKNEIKSLPNEYIWLNFNTLNRLCQANNVLNIQLRNLLSLMEDFYE